MRYIPKAFDILSRIPLVQSQTIVTHAEIGESRPSEIQYQVYDNISLNFTRHVLQYVGKSVKQEVLPEGMSYRVGIYVLTRDELEKLAVDLFVAGQRDAMYHSPTFDTSVPAEPHVDSLDKWRIR